MKQNSSAFKSFYWNFFSFLKGPGKSTLLTVLFYALWIIIDRLTYAKFELTSFNNRPIGNATFEAYDIGARVSMYYSCVLIFFLSFLGFSFLGYLIQRKSNSIFQLPEMRLINYSSLAGLSLLIFRVFDFRIFESLEIIYFLHKFALFGLLLRLFFRKTNVTIYHYAVILSLASALYFFVADVNNLLGYALYPDFYITSFIIACCLLLCLQLALKMRVTPGKIVHMIYVLIPLAFLPFFSILKDEIFLVLKANGKSPTGQGLIYLTLFLALVASLFFRSRKKNYFNLKDSVAKGYFPVLIFSFVSYTLYAYCTEYYDELFESGNVYLPLMENRLFGLIPTLEKLNTHLLSDYFLNALYAAFNGLKMHEIVLYEFLILSFSYLLFYYVIYYVSRNEFLAFFSMFLFPFAEAMAPSGSFMAVLGIFALYKICLTESRFKNYLFFAVMLLLLVIWRIDLAFSCIVALPFSLFYFHLRDKSFSINWRYLGLSFLLVVGGTLLLIGALSLYRSVNFFSKFSYFLHYSMSAQSYGLRTMGWSNLPTYKMHYFIFPVLVGLVTVFLFIKYQPFTKRLRLANLSMIYLCVFYFVSFNRGIIRHSLLESTDSFTSTVIYCILPGSVFFIFRKHSEVLKFVLFVALGFFLVINYRVPEPHNIKSPAEQLIEKLKNTTNVNLAHLKSRVLKAAPNSIAERDDFVAFIKTHTRADETYIDFSNRPMYHFFTQKETPAWFYQNPLCVRDDYLQDRFVNDLSNYKAPYLVFSGLNEQLYEWVDQVPNEVRHYRMVEYFYQHYKPYIIVDGLCLWRANEIALDNTIDTVYRAGRASYPVLDPQKWTASIKFNPQKKYLIKINYLKRPGNVDVKAFFPTKTLVGTSYLVSDTVAYCPLKTKDLKAQSFVLEVDNGSHLISELTVMECDYTPDFSSEKFYNHRLRQLPHIWGSYDKLLPAEKVLFQASDTVHKPGELPAFYFPEKIDKTSGNTIIVTCSNSNKGIRYLNLSFAPKKGRLFTTMSFEALPSDKPEKYAFRVSSNYKWYSEPNCQGFIWADNGDMTGIRVTKIEITKGK